MISHDHRQPKAQQTRATVTRGDTIALAVDNGGNGDYGYDSTGVRFSVYEC